MKIIYLDKYIVVCEKPSGTLSEGEGENALSTILSQELSKLGEKNTDIFPVHRLDRDTVGVTVYARTAAAAAALSTAITEGKFKKQYLAVICGAPEESQGSFTDLLYYDRKRGKSFVVDRERKGVRSATLDYTVIQAFKEYSLVSISLHTGRTHQIRVQFASRGFPLAGDRRYGAPKSTVTSVALCAHTLSFPHPMTRQTMTFTADKPNCLPWIFFDKILDNDSPK